MLKTVLVIVFILMALVAIGAYFGWTYLTGKNYFLEFIKSNPERVSILIVKNGGVIAEQSSDRKMPLASTVKIIVAIEYAKQAAQGKIDPAEKIALSELDLYYIPKTDGNAHPTWLKEINEKGLVSDGRIELREAAKGMIKFSSNANTEYLMEKLGLANINSNLKELSLEKHDELYPIVSALLVSSEFPDLEGEALIAKLRSLSREELITICNKVHEQLKNDKAGEVKSSYKALPLDVQKVWSDNLPGSTAKDYISIMQKLNARSFYNASVHKYLDEVMEQAMENPKNAEVFKRTGFKGGSTAFVLTFATYAETKKADRVEAAVFLNDLEIGESIILNRGLRSFLIAATRDEDFQKKIQETFSR